MRRHTQDDLSFRSILLRNEFRALKGKNNSTVVYLLVILSITFFAFGFAESMLTYQRKLSADPFSNWVNLDFHSGTKDSLRALHGKIMNDSFRERFHIRGAYFYNKGMVPVRSSGQSGQAALYEARTIDPGGGLALDLLKTGVIARYFPDSIDNAFAFEPNGVIVSSKLIDDTGLNPRTLSFIQVKTPPGDFVPVPVLAVVRELPDLSDLVYTNLFYCKTMNDGFYDRENPFYRLFVENMDTVEILNVLTELVTAFDIRDPLAVETAVLKTGNHAVQTWKIEIGEQKNQMPADAMDRKVSRLESLRNHHYGRYFKLSDDTACDYASFFHDHLAIEFNELAKIRGFAQYLDKELRLQLNLEELSRRENYLFSGGIAAGAIILLMIISVMTVSMYLSGVIRNHLNGIKKNLGNFLAFGVKNSTLTWVYILVSVRILATAMVPAYIVASVFGELFEKHLLYSILAVDSKQDYFSLVNPWFAAFLIILPGVATLRTFISVRKILRYTPGDLVYERDS